MFQSTVVAVWAAVFTATLAVSFPAAAQEESSSTPTSPVTEGQQPEEAAAAPTPRPPSALEEIVVTAEKREALLQETPVAVSAFSQQTMEDLNINHGTDYTTLVPGVSYRVSPNRLFIRGVGRTQNSLGLDPGVATYTDGVYTSETAWLFASSFGMERVEILRGPQGTLYGRNATGGAVNVIRRKPEAEFGLQGRARIANYDERSYQVRLTGPLLSERVRWSLLGSTSHSSGEQENSAGRDLGGSKSVFYEAQLDVDVTERLNAWVKWNYARWDQHPQNFFGFQESDYRRFNPATSPLTNNSQYLIDDTNPATRDPHDINVNDRTTIRLPDTYHLASTWTYDFDTVQVKYIYGFQTYDWNYRGGELDGTSRTDNEAFSFLGTSYANLYGREIEGVNRSLNFIREDKQYYSHELQIASTADSRLQWLAGYYYYNERIAQPFTIFKPDQLNLRTLCLSCSRDLGGISLESPDPAVPNGRADGFDSFVIDPATGDQFSFGYPGSLQFDAEGNPTFFLPSGIPELTTIGSSVRMRGRDKDGVIYHQEGKLKSKAWALYGELYYDLTEALKVTFGLRYSRDRKHGQEYNVINLDPLFYGLDYETGLGTFGFYPQVENCCSYSTLFDAGPIRSRRLTDNWDAWTGRVVLEWQPDPDTLVYGSVVQGYKAGGMRLGNFDTAQNPIFDKEDVLSYELGYKHTLWDDRLMVNVAGFYYDYEDKQELASFLDPGSTITLARVVNAPESEVYGVEFEFQALATANLLLMGNYSYLHSEFEDFCCAEDDSFPELGLQDLEGNDLPQSPEHKWMVGAQYTVRTDWGDFALMGRFSWVDEQTYNIFNNIYADDYHRTDLTLTFTHPENRYKVILFAKNLEDDDNYSSLGLGGAVSCRRPTIPRPDPKNPNGTVDTCPRSQLAFGGYPNPPRTFGVEVLFEY